MSDRNGQASTEASWNKHTANTNGNDHLLEADSITSEMMDSEAGIWFGLGEDGSAAPADDALAALPFGQYTLEELPCEANEGYNLITKTFWICLLYTSSRTPPYPRQTTPRSSPASSGRAVPYGARVP